MDILLSGWVKRRGWACAIFLTALSALALMPDEQLQLADGLFLRGLYDMALREYQVLVSEMPDHPRLDAALFRIGECKRELGDPRAAEEFYQRVAREHPDSPFRFRADLRRAELYVEEGKDAEAVPLLQSLTGAKPPPEIEAAALYALGRSLERLDRGAEAEAALRQVVERHTESGYFSVAAMALAARLAGQPDLAKDAELLYRRAAEKAPTPQAAAEALFQVAETAFRRQAWADSAAAYDRLFKEHPGDARAAEARLQAAWAYHHAGRYADGCALAETALKAGAGTDEADWLYLRANCERQLLKHDEAVRTYAQLIERFPEHPSMAAAAYEQALILFKQEKYAAAVAAAERIAGEGPLQKDAFWLLAESCAALGQSDKAVQYYRLVRDRYPTSEQAPVAAFRLGRLLQERGDYVEASTVFRHLATQFSNHALVPDALFGSGYCRSELKQPAEALTDWSALLTRFPTNRHAPEAFYQKAMAEIQVGRQADALKTFADLLKAFPKSSKTADARYWSGVLLEQAGDLPSAERELRAALEIAGAERKANVQYRLAAVLHKAGKYAEAADLLQELLTADPRPDMPPALLEWLARFRLQHEAYGQTVAAAFVLVASTNDPVWRQIGLYLAGRGHRGAGRAADARSCFEQSLEQQAKTLDGAEAALHLGQLLLEAGDTAGAEKRFEEAGRRADAPDALSVRAHSYYGLGRTAEQAEKWDAAARYYLSVAILFDDPELTPECLYRAADCFERLGRSADRDHARQELQQRYPESSWAAKAAPAGTSP